MSCDVVNKFVITKGLDNNFIFTIKANNSTLPLEIVDPPDTFNAKLICLGDGSVVMTKALTVADALNGKVTLAISSSDTNALISDKGTKTDRYYLRPVYKLVIECSTTNNGDFLAKVPEVYVD